MNSSTNGDFDGTTDVYKWGGIDSYIFLYHLWWGCTSKITVLIVLWSTRHGFIAIFNVLNPHIFGPRLMVKSQFFWWVKSKISALMVLVMKSQLFGLSRPGLSHGASEDLQRGERTWVAVGQFTNNHRGLKTQEFKDQKEWFNHRKVI